MGAAYFFSGFGRDEGFGAAIARALREDMPARGGLVVVASSPQEHTINDRYWPIYLNWFAQADLYFDRYSLLDGRMAPKQALDLLASAACVLLAGGDTLAQFEFLRANGYDSGLREAPGVIAGLSAGAINMGRVSVCPRRPGQDAPTCYAGLNIADVTVLPHFSPAQAHLLEEARQLAAPARVLGLPDGSAVVVRNGETAHIGPVYT